MKKAAKRPGPGWFDRREMAEILGVTEHQFYRKYQELAPATAVKRAGAKDYFLARTLLDAWIKRELDRGRPKSGQELSPEDQALFQDAPQKILDQLRGVKIEQEKIKLDLMRGDAIPRRDLEQGLTLLAASLRRATETLQRKWGNDAGEVVNAALDEAEQRWGKMLERNDPDAGAGEAVAGVAGAEADGGSDPRAKAADHAAVRRGRNRPADRAARRNAVSG